jgi:probable addiction module antidote protein
MYGHHARKKFSKLKTSTYDVAEHLRTPEEMAAYLDIWLEDAPDDDSGIARALGDIAPAKGMSQVAKEAGLSLESLYRALSEGGSAATSRVPRCWWPQHIAATAVRAPHASPHHPLCAGWVGTGASLVQPAGGSVSSCRTAAASTGP